ncbi:GNAT family N-acetyltransferase [Actinoplanes solisilvae]|uniref:GNAT family N-acetyltransferase n=1 Tax=Actinoplanes solisilvae TaxID=2486853 RepID=UPI000FD90D2E|nr:GNAT family N-acetyltransferase [Actinoplanes solisilvae]
MIVVRGLEGLGEWSAASALYRRVFAYEQPEFGISPRLLAALGENAGSVLGAFGESGELVGFCYGFSAVEAGELYHYSQAAVVAPGLQGAGLGRRLKQAQADVARSTGARTMRWTFDPYALRNAHFNFTVLGATGIRFLPDYYDDGDSDRVLVSWDLTGQPARSSETAAVHIEADARFAAPDPAERARLRDDLIKRFDAGDRLIRVEHHDGRAVYTFERAAR